MIPNINTNNVIGRRQEIMIIKSCIELGRNILLEGPVGVGKTFIAEQSSLQTNFPFFRIDGDPQLSAEKMVGYFDPPMVINHGYEQKYFIEGPLLQAMNKGGILFINELNRINKGLQNLLLSVLDEKKLFVPRMGWKAAKDGFCVIATQNPSEYIGTKQLSEALRDRFEHLVIAYQSYEEEFSILSFLSKDEDLCHKSLRLVRATREDTRFLRGASIRAAQAIVLLYEKIRDFSLCARLSLSNRVKLIDPNQHDLDSVIAELEKKNH